MITTWKIVQSCWKVVGSFQKADELNIHGTYNLEISLLGAYIREMKTYVHTIIPRALFMPKSQGEAMSVGTGTLYARAVTRLKNELI